MTPIGSLVKRTFDLVCALVGLAVLWPIIFIFWILAAHDTQASGIFRQQRIGKNGKPFTLYKLRTMLVAVGSSVTVENDVRITPLGAKLRRTKLDELPQLWNVLIGDMSFVGPRPDVPGFLDRLEGSDKELLQLRPGITGPASLKYRNEERILAASSDSERYNSEVIWPDKVRINLNYLHNWNFYTDVRIITKTIFN